MIEETSNKAMGAQHTKQNSPAQADGLQDFFFPGSGKFKPMNIRAKDQEAADASWEKDREEVEI